jgi:hypothetical protein
MRKIKVLLGTAVLVSLLGFSSFAAITTTPKGVQKLDSADIVDALNNNADVLDDHVDKIAGTDILGHVKIGKGLEITEDGTANVKIADDFDTNDSDTALSAAKGAELNQSVTELLSNVQFKDMGYVNLDTVDYDLNFVGYTQITGSSMQYSCLQFSSSGFVTQILSTNSSSNYSLKIRTAYQPSDWYNISWNTIK